MSVEVLVLDYIPRVILPKTSNATYRLFSSELVDIQELTNIIDYRFDGIICNDLQEGAT